MDALRIEGGRRLQGRVEVSGAKNAVLPAMAASLLTDATLRLSSVPAVRDVATMIQVLEHLGVRTRRMGAALELEAAPTREAEAPYDLVRTMRASILTLGPLLARHGRARVSLPGGCAIGARPVDLHLEALRSMGAEVVLEHGYIEARAGRLRGAEHAFETVTVTGTENALMAATLASGRTVLRNCAREPEVEDLATLLTAMGARISGAGEETMIIEGVERLEGAAHRVIPDRIEAGTLVMAAALAGGRVEVRGARLDHLTAVMERLSRAGVRATPIPEGILVEGGAPLKAVDLATRPYPGFPTDLQAQFMVLMTQAAGSAVIRETIFENRFMHVNELQRLGARIRVDGHHAIVEGGTPLSGAPVMATDLRASACLVLAGLVAQGETLVRRIYHLDRGYEGLEVKLAGLGARIARIEDAGRGEPGRER